MFSNIYTKIWIGLIKELLEGIIADGIPVFKFSIVITILLEAVVSEMDIIVVVIKRVGVRACSQVSILIEEDVLLLSH